MDKLKNMLNPGSKSDDNKTYGTEDTTGKTGGQGSHFGSPGSSNVASDNASTMAMKEGVTGPYSATSGTSDSSALRAAQMASGTSSSSARDSSALPIASEMTGQKYDSSSSMANPYSSQGVDSRVDGPQSRSGALGSSTAASTTFDKSNRGPEYESVSTGMEKCTSLF